MIEQFYLTHNNILPLRVSVERGVMVMKEYSAFPKAPGQKPLHQMQFYTKHICLVWSKACW